MKVCTDACLLGSIADASGAATMLDIGTGTGLLSLMMAQRFPELKIDAIEIDSAATQQASENFKKSLWNNRLNSIEGDIRYFTLTKRYDHIICNPPFYDDHLKPENKANTIARHNEELTLEELTEVVHQHLSLKGKFSVLLPPDEMKQLEILLLPKKLFLTKQLFIRDRVELPVIRVIAEFSFNQTNSTIENLIIKKDKERYTDEFKRLLKDFYVAF
jgi:tRNA1Val (adenine37-N6)-methyltransferase